MHHIHSHNTTLYEHLQTHTLVFVHVKMQQTHAPPTHTHMHTHMHNQAHTNNTHHKQYQTRKTSTYIKLYKYAHILNHT